MSSNLNQPAQILNFKDPKPQDLLQLQNQQPYVPNYIGNADDFEVEQTQEMQQRSSKIQNLDGNKRIQIDTVAFADFLRLVPNKPALYKMLTLKLQLWLPPQDACTSLFLAQILRNEKRAFQYFELCPIKVEHRNTITIKFVLSRVIQNPVVAKYLPDEPEKYVTRDYLFVIVNTLDQSFFPTLVTELEEKSMDKRGKQKEQEVVQIDSRMFEMLQKLNAFSQGSQSARSLMGLKKGAVAVKKRRRQERELSLEFETKLNIAGERRQNLRDIFQYQAKRPFSKT